MDCAAKDGGQKQIEGFINKDLIEDFVNLYAPASKVDFTHVFNRAELRKFFGAYIDFNTLDPLNLYIEALAMNGFRERLGFDNSPCIFVKELIFTPEEVVD